MNTIRRYSIFRNSKPLAYTYNLVSSDSLRLIGANTILQALTTIAMLIKQNSPKCGEEIVINISKQAPDGYEPIVHKIEIEMLDGKNIVRGADRVDRYYTGLEEAFELIERKISLLCDAVNYEIKVNRKGDEFPLVNPSYSILKKITFEKFERASKVLNQIFAVAKKDGYLSLAAYYRLANWRSEYKVVEIEEIDEDYGWTKEEIYEMPEGVQGLWDSGPCYLDLPEPHLLHFKPD